ncbi:LOB domain-containing protein 22 [Linum perenne]
MSSSNTCSISITTTNTNSNTTSLTTKNNNNSSNNNTSSINRIGNGTTPACAACKYQRRKCAPDCILTPYFPHDRQRQFLNAHKLFGVRKITKIIENLSNQAHKDEAMRSIIFQSDVRANDPVGGCYRIILQLQRQINYAQAELDLLLHHLAICRAQHHQQHQDQSTIENNNIDSAMMAVGCLDLYSDPMMLQFHCSPQPQQQPDHEEEQHQHQHHHHHHHHHENQQHHGYVVEETLQDGESVNSWGMAAGG